MHFRLNLEQKISFSDFMIENFVSFDLCLKKTYFCRSRSLFGKKLPATVLTRPIKELFPLAKRFSSLVTENNGPIAKYLCLKSGPRFTFWPSNYSKYQIRCCLILEKILKQVFAHNKKGTKKLIKMPLEIGHEKEICKNCH